MVGPKLPNSARKERGWIGGVAAAKDVCRRRGLKDHSLSLKGQYRIISADFAFYARADRGRFCFAPNLDFVTHNMLFPLTGLNSRQPRGRS